MAAEVDKREHLYKLIKGSKTAMLVTSTADGSMHARPMNVADFMPDGDTYFSASIDSPKVAEITANPQVLVTFQDGSAIASLAGKAEVVRDRALIEKLWSDAWRVWFPGGKDDPKLCIIKFNATDGEYWDNTGSEGWKYLTRAIKAVAKGETPKVDADQHAKVRL